jgi:hypothetical protein
MLLNVLSRKGDGCRAMQDLIARCHEPPRQKQAHIKRAWQLFRSLLDRKIVEFIEPRSSRGNEALNQTLNSQPLTLNQEVRASLRRPLPGKRFV